MRAIKNSEGCLFITPLRFVLECWVQPMADHLLRLDIAYLLAAGDKAGFSEGWPELSISPELVKQWKN